MSIHDRALAAPAPQGEAARPRATIRPQNRARTPHPSSLQAPAGGAAIHALAQIGRAPGPPGHMWIGLPVTAIAASFTASEWVGWAWQV